LVLNRALVLKLMAAGLFTEDVRSRFFSTIKQRVSSKQM